MAITPAMSFAQDSNSARVVNFGSSAITHLHRSGWCIRRTNRLSKRAAKRGFFRNWTAQFALLADHGGTENQGP
jgi:hypothetical protein